ncbi:unnamed protein product [Toxocara canis]|uniref:Uncharacterized protein n=1 Tax=Toxocara canis TaxID=6265 RepID=A0A183ULF2_TOXCA|nr:unnamed protein product [Toxocara canis]
MAELAHPFGQTKDSQPPRMTPRESIVVKRDHDLRPVHSPIRSQVGWRQRSVTRHLHAFQHKRRILAPNLEFFHESEFARPNKCVRNACPPADAEPNSISAQFQFSAKGFWRLALASLRGDTSLHELCFSTKLLSKCGQPKTKTHINEIILEPYFNCTKQT